MTNPFAVGRNCQSALPDPVSVFIGAVAHEGTLTLALISPWVLLIALLTVVFAVAIWLTIGSSMYRSLRENRRERAAPEGSAATKADL